MKAGSGTMALPILYGDGAPLTVIKSRSRKNGTRDGTASRISTRSPGISRRGNDDQFLGLPGGRGSDSRRSDPDGSWYSGAGIEGTRRIACPPALGTRRRGWLREEALSAETRVSLRSPKTARQHTAASLFNLLYEYLINDNQLVTLNEPTQLDKLQTGQLVELTGEYLGNPLEDILAFMATMYPYVAEQQKAQLAAASEAIEHTRKASKSRNPAKRAQAATPAQVAGPDPARDT